jgi:predicted transposase/invertase (TIGR01784 family)
MRLLPLHNDYVFKALFVRNPDILLDLINALPQFTGEHKVAEISILNPELPKLGEIDKVSILDIRAKDLTGREFILEMQGNSHPFLPERLLLYWSKTFSSGINQGMEYSALPKVYSINFFNFVLIGNTEFFHTTFQILDTRTGKIALTEHLEITIIELPKIGKKMASLQTDLERWIYFFRNAHKLKEEPLQNLSSNNPMLSKAIGELEFLSQDAKTRQIYEERLKADLDYNTGMADAFRKGEAKGKQEGILLGKEKGILEGEFRNRLNTARIMKDKGFSQEEIMEITALTKEDLTKNGI